MDIKKFMVKINNVCQWEQVVKLVKFSPDKFLATVFVWIVTMATTNFLWEPALIVNALLELAKFYLN